MRKEYNQQSSIDYPGCRRAARWNRGPSAMFARFGCSCPFEKPTRGITEERSFRSVDGLPRSWPDIEWQGRRRKDDSPSRGSPRNRNPLQTAYSAASDPFLPGVAQPQPAPKASSTTMPTFTFCRPRHTRSIMPITLVTISGCACGQDLQELRGGWGSGCQQSSPLDVERKSGYLWRIGFQR